MNKTRKILNLKEEKIETQEVLEEKNKEEKELSVMVSFASELGFSISIPIVIGAILGQILDNKLGTSPRITLSLILGGLFVGLSNIYFLLKRKQ